MKQPPSATASTKFRSWFFAVDRILRGETTQPAGDGSAEIKIPIVGVSLVVILLAVTYGFCMGIFSLIHGAETSQYSKALAQTLASMVKVPLLFLLTLMVTFPSLYVFNALIGSQLRFLAVLKLLVASLAVNLALLASMGPILAFFSASTPNYYFMVLLNVVMFAIAGAFGLMFLLQSLNRLSKTSRRTPSTAPTNQLENVPPEVTIVSQSDPSIGPLDHVRGVVLSEHVKKVFAVWIFVFGLVGAQMGWVLRPFIGSPNMSFQWFRARDSNFFEAVVNAFWNVF